MGLGGNRAFPVGVPDDNVGVRADGYHALSGIQVEDLGGVRAGDRDESRGVHYAGEDALLPEDRHPVLDAVHAVGDLREVVLAHGLLFGVERAVVTADHLEIVSERDSRHQRREDRTSGRSEERSIKSLVVTLTSSRLK